MAKKDENGRIVVPEDIVVTSTIFIATNEFKPYFFLDNCGGVGIHVNVGCPYPEDIEFLGYCDFDKETHSILLPENVDCALGGFNVGEYFFSIKSPNVCIPRVYIRKVNSENDNFSEQLSALLSNVEKLFDGIDAYINEDINE